MKSKEAVILAGGLGTRLKSEVPDLPKCMAPVAGRPFIDHLIQYFLHNGIDNFVFALGYKSESIINHLNDNWKDLKFKYTIEKEPLGTGGAILLASSAISGDDFFVLNGDTMFSIDTDQLLHVHQLNQAFITMALKPMKHFDRYGTVDITEDQKITGFSEKSFCEEGLINGGIYLVNKSKLLSLPLLERFSFEKDVLEIQTAQGTVYGVIFDSYFIDIGIPEDFRKANSDFMRRNL